jgi:translocation and assembly module TamB
VTLGDDLKIAVLGLEAKPHGALRIVEAEGKPTSATGEIRVDEGTFQAYGQDLQIESGRMVFAGPIDRPRVNLRASRTASDGTVAGLEVEGTLLEPRITLWSDPSMGSSDQLSYLLLGRPLAQATAGASAGDADLVANAARSLGLKGGDLLARQLAARFGLEEARIETENVGGLEQASLVVGKYLSPRLYLSYGVGLFGAANTLRLRYELGRRYTLQATQGLETGADILYTLERGRQPSRRDATEPRVVPPR